MTVSEKTLAYKRVILKLTGEIFRKNGDNLNEEWKLLCGNVQVCR